MRYIRHYPTVTPNEYSKSSEFSYKRNRILRDNDIRERKKEIDKFQRERKKRQSTRLSPYAQEVKQIWNKSGWKKRMLIIVLAVVLVAVVVILIKRRKNQTK